MLHLKFSVAVPETAGQPPGAILPSTREALPADRRPAWPFGQPPRRPTWLRIRNVSTFTITNLLYSGSFERHPAIRYIVAHAGGAVPYLAWRIAAAEALPGMRGRTPGGAMHYLRRLYYDTALSASEPALAALRQFVPVSQILFGSDSPLVSEEVVAVETAGLEASSQLDAGARRAIDRENALALFPRFARQPEARAAA